MKRYTEEFKKEVLEYEQTHTYKETSERFNVSQFNIQRWKFPEKHAKRARKHRVKNREKYNQWVKEHRERNPAYWKKYDSTEYRKQYYLEHKEEFHEYRKQRRRDKLQQYKHGPNQTWRNTKEYTDWKVAVYERDEYICQECKQRPNGPVHAHHIKQPFGDKNLMYDVENGITLCEQCHSTIDHSRSSTLSN